MKQPLIGWILTLICIAAPLSAQNLIRQITDPKAPPPSLNESLSYQHEFESDSKNGGDRLSVDRWTADLSFPVYGNKNLGILASPTIDVMDVENASRKLPNQLVSVGTTVFGYVGIERPLPIRFGTYLSVNLRSDLEKTNLSDAQYIASAFALVPASDELFFTPGIAYASDVAVGFLENVPIPSIQVIWAPQSGWLAEKHFVMALGVPFNIISFAPTDWLSISVFNLAGVLGRVSATANLSEQVDLETSFGTTAEVYDLGDERFRSASRLFRRDLRFTTALTYKPGADITLSANLGYAFQRRWVVGETMSVNVEERVDIKPGFFIGVSAGIEFNLATPRGQDEGEDGS